MRKLNFKILLTMLMAVGTLLNAQDTIRHLLITETRFDRWTYAYTEFTNMSETETVDLSEFVYGLLRDNGPSFTLENDVVYLAEVIDTIGGSVMRLHGMLAPGESYILMAVQDATNGEGIYPRIVQSIDLLERADTVVHFKDWGSGDDRYESRPYIPEWEMWGFDSVSANNDVVFNRHNDAPALYWISGDTIQVLVDQALGTMEWDESGTSGNYINNTDPPKSVAGVPDAHDDYTLVRKFSIKEGETNWTLAAGSDATTSSWMIIPSTKTFNRMAWETEGVHGDFHLDYSSTVYDIDDAAGTITIPWGTEKEDSIRLGLTLGAGMAWEYVEQPSFEDSLSTVAVTGDTLMLYSAGVELETKALQIIVAEPAGDMVSAFPRKAINYPAEPGDNNYTPNQVAIIGGVQYGYTQNLALDSIFEVPYATPIDTLFKLLEIAPNASYEFVWASGEASSEVSYGDLLRITGGDGSTTKDYFMAVAPIEESDNVDLKSLTWPDIPDNPYYIGQGWKGDTIPSFTPNGTTYGVMLPPGTKSVPALLAMTDDVNATIKVTRATSVTGSNDERTTSIAVTSESDTTIRTIRVTFVVLNLDAQKFQSDPIFSKFIGRDWWNAGGMEILNPSDELIDLSEYYIVKSDMVTPAEAIIGGFENDSTSWLRRWLKMIPGQKWETYDGWQIEPGKLIPDFAIDPFMEPKDVKVFWKLHNDAPGWKSYRSQIDPALGGRADYIMNGDDDFSFSLGIPYNPWGEAMANEHSIAFPLWANGTDPKHNYYLFKIVGEGGDSVRQGLKLPNDPKDFDLVDTYGAPTAPWVVNGITWPGSPNESWSAYRKTDRYKGSTELGSNFGDSATSAYNVTQDYKGNPSRRTVNQMDMGFFALDPITEHISTVTSPVYAVTRGWEGDQAIVGVSSSEDVTAFLANLNKGSEEQMLVVTNGGEKAADAAIVDGDTLLVKSENMENTTLYIISTVALSGDNVLVAVVGSGLTVDATSDPASISGFDYGTTLRSLTENLTVPATAVLNIVDAEGNLVPLQRVNNDSMYVDVVASGDYHLEVIAENGEKLDYELMPTTAASDAYVLSDVYAVAEVPAATISNINDGTTVSTFFANLLPVEGATIKVYIKSGQERMDGNLSFDDMLEVTSEDASTVVVYSLNFLTELSAYVTSDVFTVVEEDLMISVPENTTVESLVGGLVPAPSAMMMVYDVDMNEKTTGAVLSTDMVKVTSGDQRASSTYAITVITSVYNPSMDQLKVYPNPASDILYIENIPADTYVRVSDITGRQQVLTQAGSISSGLDLSGMKDGLYFLSIEKDGKILTTVKFIKK